MTIGILGAGQLGRMLSMSAIPLGLQVRCIDPTPRPPAASVAEIITGNYEDPASLEMFARGLDVVTYEFENIPLSAVRILEKTAPVYPPPQALEIGQDRLKEKLFFQNLSIPVPKYRAVESEDNYYTVVDELGYPLVVKTRRYGYDGKGQFILRNESEARKAWNALRTEQLILEEFVSFDRELSLIGARSRSGKTVFYPLIANTHKNGILRLSRAPYRDKELQTRAEGYMKKIFDELHYVGVLTIEFFHYRGAILANEIAPRVHNSGHWTIEGAATSQFENHIRAVLDYPLGSTAPRGFAAMINLIGTVPDTARIISYPDVHLHLYEKSPRKNRKLGHVTIICDTLAALDENITLLRPVIESGNE